MSKKLEVLFAIIILAHGALLVFAGEIVLKRFKNLNTKEANERIKK